MLQRAVTALGPRFAGYLVVDAEYATSTFLHVAAAVGLPVLARLKDNLPELAASVKRADGLASDAAGPGDCQTLSPPFLHRGGRPVVSAAELVRLLWLSLATTPRCRSA